MWQIVINGPGYFDTTYDVQEGTTYIGRAENNDIVLSGDQVSRRHAKLENREGALILEDVGSRNGTCINSFFIKSAQALQHGDQLMIGENSLFFRQPTMAETARTDPVDFTQMEALGIASAGVAPASAVVSPMVSPMVSNDENTSSVEKKKIEEVEFFSRLFSSLSQGDRQSFLEKVLLCAVEVAKADEGVVLLAKDQKFVPIVCAFDNPCPVCESILSEAIRARQVVTAADAQYDPRVAIRESVSLFFVDQVICMPFLKNGEEPGFIYLRRKSPRSRLPSKSVDSLEIIAKFVACGLEWLESQKERSNREFFAKSMMRYYSPSKVDYIVGGLVKEARPYLEHKETTIVVAEFASALSWKDGVSANQLALFLSEFFENCSRIVFSYDGMVEREGKRLIAVFGSISGRSDDAVRAVRCALACQREMIVLEKKWHEIRPFGMRVAIHTGVVLVGMIGKKDGMRPIFIGESNCIARQLSHIAESGQVLITGKTLAVTGARFDVIPLGEREIQNEGQECQKIAVFEVLEEDCEMSTHPGLSSN